ncbi:hypothetical protein OE88DRAFT_1737620 [Heliocybe sulcata]|uniref:Uncharacterized protein n=1 Tax=Heliocybe sulcata TaxID=5364 RepID=A0A5C3N518_9AGAM|nr:hypothetical protein OE88DRAFT_1737620 [Heliocybe sulcata]
MSTTTTVRDGRTETASGAVPVPGEPQDHSPGMQKSNQGSTSSSDQDGAIPQQDDTPMSARRLALTQQFEQRMMGGGRRTPTTDSEHDARAVVEQLIGKTNARYGDVRTARPNAKSADRQRRETSGPNSHEEERARSVFANYAASGRVPIGSRTPSRADYDRPRTPMGPRPITPSRAERRPLPVPNVGGRHRSLRSHSQGEYMLDRQPIVSNPLYAHARVDQYVPLDEATRRQVPEAQSYGIKSENQSDNDYQVDGSRQPAQLRRMTTEVPSLHGRLRSAEWTPLSSGMPMNEIHGVSYGQEPGLSSNILRETAPHLSRYKEQEDLVKRESIPWVPPHQSLEPVPYMFSASPGHIHAQVREPDELSYVSPTARPENRAIAQQPEPRHTEPRPIGADYARQIQQLQLAIDRLMREAAQQTGGDGPPNNGWDYPGGMGRHPSVPAPRGGGGGGPPGGGDDGSSPYRGPPDDDQQRRGPPDQPPRRTPAGNGGNGGGGGGGGGGGDDPPPSDDSWHNEPDQ